MDLNEAALYLQMLFMSPQREARNLCSHFNSCVMNVALSALCIVLGEDSEDNHTIILTSEDTD